MRLRVLRREQRLPAPPGETFELFADARGLEAITPPWLGVRVVTPGPIAMAPGALIAYRLRLHGVPVRWLTHIAVWEPARRFVDVQVSGPFALWHHVHEFERSGEGTLVRDTVRYALPLGRLGELAHGLFVGSDLEAIFDFRRDALRQRFGG